MTSAGAMIRRCGCISSSFLECVEFEWRCDLRSGRSPSRAMFTSEGGCDGGSGCRVCSGRGSRGATDAYRLTVVRGVDDSKVAPFMIQRMFTCREHAVAEDDADCHRKQRFLDV